MKLYRSLPRLLVKHLAPKLLAEARKNHARQWVAFAKKISRKRI